MPYLKAHATRRVTLPSDSSYYVDFKEVIRYGDLKAASRKAIRTNERGEQETDNGAFADAMLLAYVGGWNLDDEQGNVLPLTEESLAQLTLEDSNFLASLVQEAAEKREKQRKK